MTRRSAHVWAYSYAALVDDYEVVVIVYAQEPYERTGLVGYVDGVFMPFPPRLWGV